MGDDIKEMALQNMIMKKVTYLWLYLFDFYWI